MKNYIILAIIAISIIAYTQQYSKQVDARFQEYQTNVRIERCERLWDEQELFDDFRASELDQEECYALTGIEL